LDVLPLALTHWKDTIAVSLGSGDIILLDAITGSQMAVFSEHNGLVRSLTCLPDGTSLVSGSDDKTLKLWDIQTGGVIKTFHGHTDIVCSVSISSDCTTIASGSLDKTIRLWGVHMGECYHTIEQQKEVTWVCFSPTDPQHLLSESGDVVQQWDINGHQIKSIYQGYHPTFSSDGTCFVLCEGKVATIRASDSGAILVKCPPDSNGSNQDVNCCCFSTDGGLVAIAADNAVYIWDITSSNPCLVETFTGHTYRITSIIFSSSSLISASSDRSVKFWQIGTQSTIPVVTNTSSSPPTSAVIESVTLQAKDNIAISGDYAGVVRVWDLSTGLCKAFFQNPAKGRAWKDAQIIDDRLILVGHLMGGEEVYIWDIEKEEPLQTVEAHTQVRDLRISGDGSKVFCLGWELIQVWSMWTGEVVGEVELMGLAVLGSLYVDGSKIWVWFKDSSTQGWDFGILGPSPIQLSNTSSERPHLNFIKSYRKGDPPPRIKDTVTGKEVFRLSGRYANPFASQWDGRYLVAGYGAGEVVILDCNHLCVQ
jgi:WD40 repeat protein